MENVMYYSTNSHIMTVCNERAAKRAAIKKLVRAYENVINVGISAYIDRQIDNCCPSNNIDFIGWKQNLLLSYTHSYIDSIKGYLSNLDEVSWDMIRAERKYLKILSHNLETME